MAKSKKLEVKTFSVPVQCTFSGDILVEATSPEEARAVVNSGEWTDETFTARAAVTDCEIVGKVREVDL